MEYVAGFIGIGNMGGSLANAVFLSKSGKICVCDTNVEQVNAKATALDADVCDAKQLVSKSKYIFLGVKPNAVTPLLESIADFISRDSVIVSMAAGVSTTDIVKSAKTDRIIRIMPNTPVSVGEGIVLYCMADGVTKEDEQGFLQIMARAGLVKSIDEKQIDAAAALSGCGPAFVYMFIDALADGAVKCGLSRENAVAYAKQTVLGSAALAISSEKHLEQLKDEVCSPGGTTIEGVLALEKNKFRHAASSAVIAAYEKTSKLKK